jgi:hypothetical protein
MAVAATATDLNQGRAPLRQRLTIERCLSEVVLKFKAMGEV